MLFPPKLDISLPSEDILANHYTLDVSILSSVTSAALFLAILTSISEPLASFAMEVKASLRMVIIPTGVSISDLNSSHQLCSLRQ